jgi:hypothetical protein
MAGQSSIALPSELALLGAPGCRLLISVERSLAIRTDIAGVGSIVLPRPPSDMKLFAQAILFDRNFNAAGIILSGAVELSAPR